MMNWIVTLRKPDRILYVRYSSRNWGASHFRASNLIATDWLLSRLVPMPMSLVQCYASWRNENNIDTFVQDTKTAFAYFFAHSVMNANNVGWRRRYWFGRSGFGGNGIGSKTRVVLAVASGGHDGIRGGCFCMLCLRKRERGREEDRGEGKKETGASKGVV